MNKTVSGWHFRTLTNLTWEQLTALIFTIFEVQPLHRQSLARRYWS